jgi:hypothetical protein
MGLLEVLEDRYAEALEALKSLPIRWDRERFAFWLRQDYPFVEALYCYQAGLLLEAPRPTALPWSRPSWPRWRSWTGSSPRGRTPAPRSTQCAGST